MTSRCNQEAHAAGKSNLKDDQVIYDRCIALLLSSFLDLLLSASFSRCRLSISFSLVRLASIARSGLAEGRATPPNQERDAAGGMNIK